jgi:hypothetical protein
MKRLLPLLCLCLPLGSFASTGGASDETLFLLYLTGLVAALICLLESPKIIRKLRTKLSERKRLRLEKRAGDLHSEENHYFAGTW